MVRARAREGWQGETPATRRPPFRPQLHEPNRQLSVTSATRRGLPSALLAGACFRTEKGLQADWRPRPRRLHLPLA